VDFEFQAVKSAVMTWLIRLPTSASSMAMRGRH
jgi:hypothetical protein